MFATYVQIFNNGDGESSPQLVCDLIDPINREKYPALSVEEQAIGVPLQILCLAILDTIFIHIANRVAPTTWERIRQTLCRALIFNKIERICNILASSYHDQHVIFLQEASAALVAAIRANTPLSNRFALLLPDRFDARRDQNSIILIDRRRFLPPTAADVTALVLAQAGGAFLAPGDLFAASVADAAGLRWLLVCFHGDSAGLATQPTVRGLHRACCGALRAHVLLAGLDANTHSHGAADPRSGVAAFRRLLAAQGMASAWDGVRDPFVKTTCGARTTQQPQLGKAVGYRRRFSAASASLKDWIVAYAAHAEACYYILLYRIMPFY